MAGAVGLTLAESAGQEVGDQGGSQSPPRPAIGSATLLLNDFAGCDPSGASPSDAAFVAWVAAMNASPRGRDARIDPGVYRLTMSAGPLVIRTGGNHIHGGGRGNTLIVIDNPSSDWLRLEGAMNEVADLQVTHRDHNSQGKTGVVIGCVVNGRAGFNTIHDVVFDGVSGAIGPAGPLSPGAWHTANTIVNIRAVVHNVGLDITGALNWSVRDSDFQMTGAQPGSAAIVVGSSSEGCFFSAVQALGGQYAWLFNNIVKGGVAPKDHELTNCVGDGGSTSLGCWSVRSGRRNKMTACWASCQNPSMDAAAVYFHGTGNDQDVYGNEWCQGSIENVAKSALAIDNGASGTMVANSRFANWSLLAEHEAILLAAGGSKTMNAMIVNNRFARDFDFGAGHPKEAIKIESGPYDRYVVAGNLNENGAARTVLTDLGTPSGGRSVTGNI